MSTKEEYLAKLQTQLDSWKVEADELEAKASEATEDLKVELDEQIANLRVKFAEGETKFHELADTTEEAWEELKVDAEAMFDKLIGDFKVDAEHAVEGAKGIFAKIKSMFS
jgi:predicted  nucleic acid-binding Zn-ribbon protein